MVTRRNRAGGGDSGIRTPQAATFRALSVPMIPATRRSGVGDNAARLADALRGFSSSLSGLASVSMQSDRVQQKMLDADQRDSAAFNTLAEGDATTDKDAEARRFVATEVGIDPNAASVAFIEEFKRTTAPAIEKDLDDWSANEAINGFKLPTGEEGQRDPRKTYTPKMLEERRNELWAQYDKMYPATTKDNLAAREIIRNRLQADYLRNKEALSKARIAQAREDYNTYAPSLNNTFVKERLAAGVPPKAIWDAVNEHNNKIVANRYFNVENGSLVGSYSKLELSQRLLEGLEGYQYEDATEALGVLEMLKDAKVAGQHPLLAHPTLGPLAHKVRKQAQDKIAEAEHTQLVEGQIKGALDSGLGMKAIENKINEVTVEIRDPTTGIRNTPKTTKKQIMDSIKERIQMRALEKAKGARTLGEKTKIEFDTFKPYGILPPDHEAAAQDFSLSEFTGDAQDPKAKALFEMVKAYRASGNGLQLNRLFKGNKEALDAFLYLEQVEQATGGEIELGTALNDYIEAEQTPGPFFAKSPKYKETWGKISKEFTNSESNYSLEDETFVKNALNIYSKTMNPTAAELEAFSKGLFEKINSRRPVLNGYRTDLPPGLDADPEAVKMKIDYLQSRWDTLRTMQDASDKDGWTIPGLASVRDWMFAKNTRWQYRGQGDGVFVLIDESTGEAMSKPDGTMFTLSLGQLDKLVGAVQKIDKGELRQRQATQIRENEEVEVYGETVENRERRASTGAKRRAERQRRVKSMSKKTEESTDFNQYGHPLYWLSPRGAQPEE